MASTVRTTALVASSGVMTMVDSRKSSSTRKRGMTKSLEISDGRLVVQGKRPWRSLGMCAYLTRGDGQSALMIVPLGFISVYPWSSDDRCKADIGYAIAANYWGHGIATKAVKMAVPQVFKDFPHLLRLQAFAALESKASQRVLEKAGFLEEGVLRKYTYLKGSIKDLVVFSFLSTDEFPPSDQLLVEIIHGL